MPRSSGAMKSQAMSSTKALLASQGAIGETFAASRLFRPPGQLLALVGDPLYRFLEPRSGPGAHRVAAAPAGLVKHPQRTGVHPPVEIVRERVPPGIAAPGSRCHALGKLLVERQFPVAEHVEVGEALAYKVGRGEAPTRDAADEDDLVGQGA